MNLVTPLISVREALAASLIERDGEIETALLGLVAREHVLFVGPPGTAKSQLATSVTQAISGASAFSVLLTKFTTPEELFGPVMLSALKRDKYERAIDGYAPTAEILFVDEIWKASSAILNTLLTLLQERAYDNGGTRVQCPLRLAIAASNEWPSAEDGQELGAIFDRFLIRRVVRSVSPQGRTRLLYEELPTVPPCVSLGDIDKAADQAAQVTVSEAARKALGDILDELSAAGVRPGDRRCRKSVKIARAAAWLDGHVEVAPRHLECLADVLWADPEQADKCAEIVTRIANPVGAQLNGLLREIDDVVQKSGADAAARTEAVKKLEQCEKRAKELTLEGNGRALKVLQHVRGERTRLIAMLLGIDPAKAAAHLGSAA